MKSTFNMDEFLQSSVDPGGTPLDTKIELVPDGYEGQAQITSVMPRSFQQSDGEWRLVVNVIWSIMDPALSEKMGIGEPRAQQTLWIDTPKGWTPDHGFSFEVGRNKNTDTGRFLKALGMNSGKTFRWGALLNETAFIRVAEPRDTERAILADVKMVARTVQELSRKAA